MPVRNDAKPSEAPKKEVKKAPVKAAATDKNAEPKTVQKSPLEEKVKKFIAEVNPEYVDKINDIFERQILDNETKDKANVVFTAFSPNGSDDEEIDDAYNIGVMKDILFAYHTLPEKAKSGKAMVVEVIPPAEADAPHMICFHEVS